MRTHEDIVEELKHHGYHFAAAVRKGPAEFPQFAVFEDKAGHKAVILYSEYELAELFLPASGVVDAADNQARS